MSRKFVVAVTLMASGAVVAARGQELPPVQQPPVAAPAQDQVQPTTIQVEAQADAELKRQTDLFEVVLRQAVEQGGQRLAQWARQVAGPGVVLAQASNPIVQAVPLPDSSLVFNVQVPEILQTSVRLLLEQLPVSARPVSQPVPGRVGATSAVPEGPVVNGSGSLDPDRRYSDYVREALIDALLDGSAVLRLEPGQWLTVAASGVDIAVTNPLYRNPSRKLVLSVKAEDLMALRLQQITRDEARARILERRF